MSKTWESPAVLGRKQGGFRRRSCNRFPSGTPGSNPRNLVTRRGQMRGAAMLNAGFGGVETGGMEGCEGASGAYTLGAVPSPSPGCSAGCLPGVGLSSGLSFSLK